MYKTYYNLLLDPFDIQGGASAFWVGAKQKAILGGLKRNIIDQRGIFLLTGQDGLGKTSMVDALTYRLRDQLACCHLHLKDDDKLAFYNSILIGFGLELQVTAKVQFFLHITDYLQKIRYQGKIGLLIIDNAELLSVGLIEEIRHITNIEHNNEYLINVLLVGSPRVANLINSSLSASFKQKLILHYKVPPLSLEDTYFYITHRLRAAGTSEKVFTDKAIEDIGFYSLGVIRNINSICETALLLGHRRDKKPIDSELILESAKQLKIGAALNVSPSASITPKPSRVKNKVKPKETTNSSNKPKQIPKKKEKKIGFGVVTLVAAIGLIVAGGIFSQLPSERRDELKSLLSTSFVGKDKQGEDTILEQSKTDDNPIIQQPSPEQLFSDLPTVGPTANELTKEVDKKIEEAVSKEDMEKTLALKETKKTVKVVKKSKESATPPTLKPPKKKVVIKKAIAIPVKKSEEMAVKEVVVAEKLINQVVAQDESKTSVAVPPKQEVVLLNQDSHGTDFDEIVVIEAAPLTSSPLLTNNKIILETKPNSSQVTNEGMSILKRFANELKLHPQGKVKIEGYIASKNNSEGNIELSRKRAALVKQFFIKQGVASRQLVVEGMGNQNPIGDNNTSEGKRANRRVEITILEDYCHQ